MPPSVSFLVRVLIDVPENNVVALTKFTNRSKTSLEKCFTYLKFLLASFQLDVSMNVGCPSGDTGPIHLNK